MTITNFEPTSRCAIRPSGEAFDLVRPGISRVVGLLRGGADELESLLLGGLEKQVRHALRVRGFARLISEWK